MSRRKRPNVELVSMYHMESWNAMKPIFSEFAQLLGKIIRVRNAEGETCRPRSRRGTIDVIFYSTPIPTDPQHYHNAFGFDVSSSQGIGREPTYDGLAIRDEEKIVAEIHGRTLYILFDLPRNSYHSEQILRHIMDSYVNFYVPLEENDEHIQKLSESIRSRSRKQFIDISSKRIDRTVDRLEKGVVEEENQIKAYKERLVKAIRDRKFYKDQLDKLRSISATDHESYEREFDSILTNPLVTSMVAQDGEVIIFTKELITGKLPDDTRRLLGKYVISIDLNRATVHVWNQTQMVDYSAHPHAYSDGTLCLGNIDETISNFIATYRIAPLIQMLLVFLQNPNPDDPLGSGIYDWPLAEMENI